MFPIDAARAGRQDGDKRLGETVAFNERLAGRVEDALLAETGIVKKKMFGVACYMRNGNAFAGVWHDALIVRTGPASYQSALVEPHVREFDITGKPMTGWVVVDPDGMDDESSFRDWLNRAMEFAGTLPKKPANPPKSV
ncbi:MAG: TfoX/Sxy family protein [Pirellulales bacterium]